MEFSVISASILSTTATGTALRALWVVALAFLVLWMIDRMKPPTTRRTIPVRVDRNKAPLYREPERPQKMRALGNLSGGAVIVAALLAFLFALTGAVVLEVVGGLLGN